MAFAAGRTKRLKFGMSVMVLPGAGAEPAEFGLCRYPDNPHWQLTGFCKTQYAARHGWEHFLLCHRRIISLLDLWRDFGVDVKVLPGGEIFPALERGVRVQRWLIAEMLTAAFVAAERAQACRQGQIKALQLACSPVPSGELANRQQRRRCGLGDMA